MIAETLFLSLEYSTIPFATLTLLTHGVTWRKFLIHHFTLKLFSIYTNFNVWPNSGSILYDSVIFLIIEATVKQIFCYLTTNVSIGKPLKIWLNWAVQINW
jgi:hypothetical protein